MPSHISPPLLTPTMEPTPFSPQSLFDMQGRVVVITGGGGKLSQAFAQALGGAGAKLVLADVRSDLAQSAAKRSVESNVDAIGVTCDTSYEDDVKKLFKQVQDHYGRVDSLIHNVMSKPVNYYKPFTDYPTQAWNDVIAGNLTGAFLTCREAARQMDSGGSVVLTGSIYGLVGPDQRIYKDQSEPNPYAATTLLNTPASYSASKAGLLGLVHYLAALWGPRDIRVNMLTPGGIEDGQDQTFIKAYSERTPLQRMATWQDYQGAILLLCSDASRYMTGSNLIVDGGWTAW